MCIRDRSQYSEANNNMVELVIANNDEMAIGSVTALQNAGYNKEGATVIPVFGVDATDAAKDAIAAGTMTGDVYKRQQKRHRDRRNGPYSHRYGQGPGDQYGEPCPGAYAHQYRRHLNP